MNDDYIKTLDENTILSCDTFDRILSIPDNFERQAAEEKCRQQAKKLGCMTAFKKLLTSYRLKTAPERCRTARGNVTEFTDQPLQLNCGSWVCNDSGVHRTIIDNRTGEPATKCACPFPVMITESLHNIDTGVYKVRITFYNNGWKSIICNTSTISSATKIIELADAGITVNTNTAKLLVTYFGDLIALNDDIIPKNEAIGRLGWMGNNVFVPYLGQGYTFDGEKEYKSVFEAVGLAGDMDEYIRYTVALRENISVRLIMGASLASPLIELINGVPFIFHLWGETGAGKTVALMLATSIWGNPAKGKMWRSMNNTVNYAMQIASVMRNIPVGFDELQTIKQFGGNYDQLIMSLCEGVNRGRMSYNKLEAAAEWNCSFIFTGEESITRENSGGGAKNRVIEVNCENKIIQDGKKTVDVISNNYGWLGKCFVADVMTRSDVPDIYRRHYNDITDNTGTTEKQAAAMSFILTADELVNKFYPAEKPLTVADIEPFLMNSKEVDIASRAWDYTVNMIAANASKFSPDTYGEIWGRINEDGTVLVNKTILMREMSAAGFEFDAVKKRWAERGQLIRNSQGKFHHYTKCHSIKAMYINLCVKSHKCTSNEGIFRKNLSKTILI